MLKRLTKILLTILICNYGNLLSQNLTVIPQPIEVIKTGSNFSLSGNSISIKISVKDTTNLYIPLDELSSTLKTFKEINLDYDGKSSNVIWIGLTDDDKNFYKICKENALLEQDGIGEEGYSLLIKKDLILIAANKSTGLFYGIQTLKQLIIGNKDNSFLPGVNIFDYPTLKYRGILDDISRGPVPTFDYMKQQVRRLAGLKMNTLQYYIENVVMTKYHPEFAPPDGSITIDEIKDLSAYAKKYHVMLIGNFQSFGHFEKILAHPEYSRLGEKGSLLSPAFPESIKLLKDIYSEMVPAFDSPFFNVDADETFDLGKGASKELVDSLGYAVVYTDQIKKMYSILKDLDVRMMMWGDILLKYPESLNMLPKDIIMMTWGYDAKESYDDMILPFKNAGYDFTISPGVLNSYSTMPDFSVSMPNIKNLVRDGVKYGSMGMVLTVWDDGGSAFFSRDWYGVAYGAEHSWNPNERSLPDFNERFNKIVYADKTGDFTKAVWKLVELTNVPVTNGLKEKLLWTKVIPDSGEVLRIGTEGWDKVKEIVDSAEIYLNEAKPLLHKKDYDYFRFTVEQYRFNADLRFNLMHAVKLYSGALHSQNADKSFTRRQLIDAIDAIGSSRKSLINLYDFYRDIWLNENKTSAMVVVLDKYQSQINDLKDVERRIYSALRDYDSGLDLPEIKKVRLGIEKGEGRFFREWMMINPIPIRQGEENSSVDYLKNKGGELNAVPKVSQEFEYNGNTYRWRRTASEYFDIVNLKEELPGEDSNVVTYAFANIDSPDDRTVKASIGSTDGVDVIINGNIVYSFRKERELKIDEDTFELPLKKGRNNLMLKLYQEDNGWEFTFRLPEYEVSNSKNRYKITE